MAEKWDVFICHASEDKESFVQPLAEILRKLGVSVWYDKFSFELGDSLSKGIDRGIAGSSFGVVVVSKAFVGKAWPEHELQGLVNRNVEENLKIIPIWHGVTKYEVRKFSPSLADRLAIDTRKDNAQEAAIKLLRVVRPDLYEALPRAELEELATGKAISELQNEIEELRNQIAEYQCPYCAAAMVTREHIDYDEKNSGVVETFECGYSTGGWQEHPCPLDPKFPKLEDYDLVFDTLPDEPGKEWQCYAQPKTVMARKVHLDVGYARTKEEAKKKVEANYLYHAGRITNQEWFRIQIGADG